MKLEELYEVIQKRIRETPEGSYVATVSEEGLDRAVQKVGEEAVEVLIAAKNEERERIISESADLLFHLLILLAMRDISLEDIGKELNARK